MLYGDRNTKFFHESPKAIRKRKKIECLKNKEGDWIDDKVTLRNMASMFFLKLYIKDNFTFTGFPLNNAFLKLNAATFQEIDSPKDIK